MSDDAPDPTQSLANVVASGADLEQLTRTILELLNRVTGLESAYLTAIDWALSKQEVLFADNAGGLVVPEGTVVAWEDTLCRRAMLTGRQSTADVAGTYGTDNGGHELGIVSYASVPVVTADRAIFGTLCAASASGHELSDDHRRLMELFARLIGDQVTRERALIDERRRSAAAEELTRARGLMIAESEHRVKTPLTVIRGAAATLAEHWEHIAAADARIMVEAVMRGADDLAGCIDVLLKQAREEMDAPILQPKALFIEPELTQLAADFSLISSRHPVSSTATAELVARADPVALRQVLGHLIDNAIKYAVDGSPIELSAQGVDGMVVISVADRGPGLPEADVFIPFERGEGSPGRSAGTGLGLHIVRSLVEDMGGSVTAQPRDGGGTAFRIVLPGV